MLAAVVCCLLFPALALAQAPTFSESLARGAGRAKRAVTLQLVIKPNARGRQAVARHPGLRVSVAVRYTPQGGTSRILRFAFRIP